MSSGKIKKLFTIGLTLGVFVGVLVLGIALAHAQPDTSSGLNQVGQNTGLSTQSLGVTIGQIVRAILGVLGIVAFGITFYAGYLWMTAAGNEDQVARAKTIMRNALIGLIVILASFSVTQYILSRLLGATNNLPSHCFNGVKDEDETNIDCGGSCGACSGGPGTGGELPGSNVLYISSLPASGEACIRNVHPTIIFNREVDIATVNNNITIQKKAGTSASGTWKYGEQKNIATFAPEGDCGGGGTDCLEAEADYILTITTPEAIKSLSGNLSLNCTLQAGCGPVDFKTGAGVDRLPPTISILSPSNNSTIPSGGVPVPVKVQFSDDNGLQSLALYQDTSLVTSQSLSGCKKSGTVDLNWPTALLAAGPYTLQAAALDWAAHSAVTSTKVRITPFHCFNNVLEADLGEIEKGPPACGGECGSCGGDTCRQNSDCASGYCETNGSSGTCVDKMRIENISPGSGAPGTFITLSGYYFGDKPGEVYFSQGATPDITRKTNVIKANLAGCGPNTRAWTSNQIIVEVPAGATNGPLFVLTDAVVGRDGVSRKFTDATNDTWGPRIVDFQITAQVRPGLCSVIPDSGVGGDTVQLLGKNFGLFDSTTDQVLFGNVKAGITAPDWSNEALKTSVPSLLDQGVVGVKVVNNGIESNGVRFIINQGQNTDAPIISTITPGSGAKGEYVTITGKNFGSTLGAVWFKSSPESEAIVADTNFPTGCANSIWRDDQIIIKFPKDKGDIGTSYYLQIKTNDNKTTRLDSNFKFTLVAGDPAPGICSLSPVSGPIPFPVGENMTIRGEYFGTSSTVYFWKTGANAKTIDGRVSVEPGSVASINDNTIILRPPTTISTGPIIVYRPLDKKISNPASFTILDCVKNSNTCTVVNTTCCASGVDAGVCKPSNEVCSGATASSGYVWRFSTADIPLVPQVVERCSDDTNNGKNIPTPAPSVQWDNQDSGDQHNACRTALITTEFTQTLSQATVNSGTVIVNKCSGVKDQNNCINPTAIKLTPESFSLKAAVGETGGALRQYLALSPDAGKWDDTTWYQVVLKKGITSDNKEKALTLSADRPCDVTDSAYCFVFKTDTRDCRIKAVVITPYSYWTSVLESPMQYRINGQVGGELRYYGLGLSDQKCIMMDTSNFDWQWNSEKTTYADIFGQSVAQSAQVSALGNTVGIGLTNPDNAVNITATARRGVASYTGKSPLTVDLNDPEVVNFWPQCLEACTNAEVGVQFNTTMSNRNLPGSAVGGTIQLLKCVDENCRGTVPVLKTSDVYLDPATNFSILKIANSQFTSAPLEPNTLYQVIISASTTNPLAASNMIWSSSFFNNPTSYSKPYNKIFTWRFKTKDKPCVVDHVGITPPNYVASSIDARTTYSATPYSSPDSCSKDGQKLDPWVLSWQWQSSDTRVAAADTFITKGTNRYCTSQCVRKGSDIPAGGEVAPICGNGVVEAGEDCDGPDKNKGCSLDCRFTGSTGANCGNGTVEQDLGEACDTKDSKTAQGCTNDCRHAGSGAQVDPNNVTASICGNGTIGAGEDCDQGILASSTNKSSSLNCSEKCVHLGTKISAKWCFDNRLTRAGFSPDDYNRYCNTALSQCGNKVQEPDEDPGCDDVTTGWNQTECNQFCLKLIPRQCTPNTEGCDNNGRYQGSSLLYSKPAVCGDGIVGTGEDRVCEQTFTSTRPDPLVNPWVLVRGIGRGDPFGEPPIQRSTISGGTKDQTKGGLITGAGTFDIKCGYKNDQDCQKIYGPGYGVGTNSCCYAQAKLLSTYPADKSINTCPNTYIEATFDSPIDQHTLPGNVIIARGGDNCAAGQEDVTALVASIRQEESTQLAWYEQIFKWFKHFFGSPAEAAPTHWCAGSDLGSADAIPSDNSTSTSRVQIKLENTLANSADYLIILKDGVKTIQGVSIGKVSNKPISWRFSTAAQICQLNSVMVNPSAWSFSRAGATTTLQAKAATAGGALIQGIPNAYDWEYIWGPGANPYVTLTQTTSSVNTITAQNRNGEQEIRAAARITVNKFTSATGTVATGNSHIIVFLCENPWPPKDLYVGNKGPFTIFPFEDKQGNNDGFDIASNTFNNTPIPASSAVADGYFNFGTYYCADKGSPGVLDDLPYLRGTVQVSSTIVSSTSSLKRFIFTNTQNSDAIGIQVFSNPLHLTAEQWYSNAKNEGGQGFGGTIQHLTINGYDAVTDGSNIYVDALNYSTVTNNVYSNIYLFSINENATADTKVVFEQFIQNLRFNNNMTNYGYCGATNNNPDFTTVCKNDLDCAGGQVCSVTTDKLKRNYQRLRGLKALQNLLAAYYSKNSSYPDLPEGTFLKGQNFSVWPSWTGFGTALGADLAVDPINQLGKAGTCSDNPGHFCTEDSMCAPNKCVLHEPQTGWSTVDRRFSFACATSSYAYRYIAASTTDFTVKAHFENTGLTIANFDNFTKEFVTTSKFIINDKNGICNQDQEISTINQGRCGDGTVNTNLGEECDPPGYVRYGTCQPGVFPRAGTIKVDVCSSSCKWTPSSTPYIDCNALSKCGNGKIEIGEACDEGTLNGRYNHCAKNCTLPPAESCGDGIVQNAYETCDIKDKLTGKDGVCVDGVHPGYPCDTNGDCQDTGGIGGGSSYSGTCRLISDTKIRYAHDQKNSCNFDCQSYGPYCGDGVVESQFGEECDGSQSCSVGGATGNKVCNTNCRWGDSSAAAWWRFDDAFIDRIERNTKFFDVSGSSTLSCTTACPTFVDHARGDKNAFKFDGAEFVATVTSTYLSPTSGSAMGLTVEAWVNPATSSNWMRILEKGGYLRNGGYTFQFNGGVQSNRTVGLVVWNTGSKVVTGIGSIQELSLNQWTHVVATYQRRGEINTFKIYINGKLDNSFTTNTPDQLLASTNDQLVVGKATSGGSFFEGMLSDVKVYTKVLSDAEISDHYSNNWVCSVSNSSVVVAPSGSGLCGDGKIDEGEACDRGSQNGTVCTPSYGKSCSYCSAECKNVVDVTSKEFCGNGIIESTESCDTDPATSLIYSSVMSSTTKSTKEDSHKGYQVLTCQDELQDKYSYKKGVKSCVGTCSGFNANCTICGMDTVKGVGITGVILSALTPDYKFGALQQPAPLLELVIGDKTIGHLQMSGVRSGEFTLLRPDESPYYSPSSSAAKISSDPSCSTGNPHYQLRIRNDTSRIMDFPISTIPAPGQYSLVMSPVIQKSKRPNQIRVVVTSIGSAVDFYSGLLIPARKPTSTVEGATFPLPYIGPSYDYTSSTVPGIWYHGFGTVDSGAYGPHSIDNIESYTLDLSQMSDTQYGFYVRVGQSGPTAPGIWSYRDSTKLKVDIYLPEDESSDQILSKPARTFYVTNATPSANPRAAIWHVFDIRQSTTGGNPGSQINPINTIVTNFQSF